MNASIFLDELTNILTREFVQCDSLAQNIVREREAIKRLALQEFVSINQSRIAILDCLHSLKEELDTVLDRLAIACHVPEAGRTLTEILPRTHSPQAGEILQQYERLADKARAVKHDIAVNQLLIKNAQSFLIRATEAHHQPPPVDDLYTVSGSRSNSGMPAALIRREG
ncbi:MAG: flagellar export chaperone FlgN [Nitrospira sp.]|nr:flagellar export chaperone FlgN [Nitrospira sp.]